MYMIIISVSSNLGYREEITELQINKSTPKRLEVEYMTRHFDINKKLIQKDNLEVPLIIANNISHMAFKMYTINKEEGVEILKEKLKESLDFKKKNLDILIDKIKDSL